MPVQEKKTNKLTVALIIILIIHLITIFLSFMYAFHGTYTANQASNLWSIIWGKGVGLIQLLSGLVSLILAICGLVMSKGSKLKIILSILLLISLPLGLLSLVYAIGTHF